MPRLWLPARSVPQSPAAATAESADELPSSGHTCYPAKTLPQSRRLPSWEIHHYKYKYKYRKCPVAIRVIPRKLYPKVDVCRRKKYTICSVTFNGFKSFLFVMLFSQNRSKCWTLDIQQETWTLRTLCESMNPSQLINYTNSSGQNCCNFKALIIYWTKTGLAQCAGKSPLSAVTRVKGFSNLLSVVYSSMLKNTENQYIIDALT